MRNDKLRSRWRPIRGYPAYSVSDSGHVRHGNRRLSTAAVNSRGYPLVMLYRNGRGKLFLTHRLVASVFCPNPRRRRCVDHIDNNKRNNRAQNLQWVTRRQNSAQAHTRDGVNVRGQRNGNAKLTWNMVEQIRRTRVMTGWSYARLARLWEVSAWTIGAIVTHKLWKRK